VTILTARETGWTAAESRPAMANDVNRHSRIGLTSRAVLRDGVPWIPVSGEIHYSRVPRDRWRERLLLMKSGGVDVISSYVIWIHHEPTRGDVRFDDNLDIAAFVRLCEELGLLFVLRIGPWAHGEVRNGGFPDWVQEAEVIHRSDDPAYLVMVREWFAALGEALADVCGPTSPIIAIQIENELYDQPQHLSTLKAMAREAGLTAPLYTATAWGGADLPAEEFFPVYSGYGDGFWVDAAAPWDNTFRQHYFFSDKWDDPGVGADVRGVAIADVAAKDRDESFPPATCELGGGMATTYHRRIVPTGADIAAVANAKIGSGSAWQGYYMYAGGSNPGGDQYQESHRSGYPNDLPTFDYDFHAAVGSAGQLGASHAMLRRQHAFLAAFGDSLATLPAAFPDLLPTGVDDSSTLRWSVRGADGSGFVFINWHQPHIPLPTLRQIRPSVEHGSGMVVFSDAPLDIVPGTIARWPYGLTMSGTRLNWATASVLTVLHNGTLVLVAEPDLDVQISVGHGVPTVVLDGALGGFVSVDGLSVLVIGYADADRVWVLEGNRRTVALCNEPLWEDGGQIVVRSATRPNLMVWDTSGWKSLALEPCGTTTVATTLAVSVEANARAPLESYGLYSGRQSAPAESDVTERSARYRFGDVGVSENQSRRTLRVDWAGDVAQLLVDGRIVADRFWDGTPWYIDLDSFDGATGDAVSLRILPLHGASSIRLPAAAEDRRRSTTGALCALDAVSLARSAEWRSGADAPHDHH
jgi:beta-galactosidase